MLKHRFHPTLSANSCKPDVEGHSGEPDETVMARRDALSHNPLFKFSNELNMLRFWFWCMQHQTKTQRLPSLWTTIPKTNNLSRPGNTSSDRPAPLTPPDRTEGPPASVSPILPSAFRRWHHVKRTAAPATMSSQSPHQTLLITRRAPWRHE